MGAWQQSSAIGRLLVTAVLALACDAAAPSDRDDANAPSAEEVASFVPRAEPDAPARPTTSPDTNAPSATTVAVAPIAGVGESASATGPLVPPSDASANTPARRAGTIMAHGGGAPGNAYMKDFARRCGTGAHLVVIPTATYEKKTPPYRKIRRKWAKRGFDPVTILHTHDREVSTQPTWSAALDEADCAWLSGGAQLRLEAAYLGTPVVTRLRAVLARGGVVGGYSAGASILAETMIRRGKEDPEDGRGFNLLPGVIIDQHFVAMHREPRLLAMLQRYPHLVGYGIDEKTGLVVTGREFEVVGSSVVRECHHDTGCISLPPGTKGHLGR